jgi:hypothetical protein
VCQLLRSHQIVCLVAKRHCTDSGDAAGPRLLSTDIV